MQIYSKRVEPMAAGRGIEDAEEKRRRTIEQVLLCLSFFLFFFVGK